MTYRQSRPRATLVALAVASALMAMAAGAGAQAFDPTSPAVRDAYTGPVTSAKIEAALTGLNTTSSVTQLIFGSIAVIDAGTGGGGFFGSVPLFPTSPGFVILGTIFAASDADLGAPGAPVDLKARILQTQASFATGRDFAVENSTINTNAFDLTLNGVVTASGLLVKSGTGTLTLNGANVWNGHTIQLAGGTLLGNASSLGTYIATSSSTTVQFDQGVDGTYSSQMSGAGSFVKNGPAKLTITGNNTLGGEVRIEQGTLALSGAGAFGSSSALKLQPGTTLDIAAASGARHFGALSGSGTIVLGANTLDTFSGSGASTAFGGSISGTGGFTKSGPGTLTVTSNLLYSGLTAVSGGTLRLEGAGRINPTSPVSVGSSAVLDMSPADGSREIASLAGAADSTVRLGANTLTVGGDNTNSTYSGSLQGTGGLTKTGGGTLTLDGTSSYTGTTTVASGTLNVRARSISETTVNNATLVFSKSKESFGANYTESDTDVYSGTIGGTGNVIKEGGGALWLRGANSYTGGTTVSGGALIGNTASLQGNIANNATLAFYQVADGAYSGNLSGNGKVFVYGPGLVNMTGNAAANFTGVGGRLFVTGSLASDVGVAPSAEFGGTGTITGTVVNAGRLTRGSPAIGQINVNGNVAFVPGSTLAVKADAAGNSDRLVLGSGGAAAIGGGTVDVKAQAGTYAPQTLYNIVQAPGGVTGQFSAVTSDLAFLSPALAYDANNVFLTLTRNDVPFAAVAATPNQASTASAFASLVAGESTNSDRAAVLTAIGGLSAAQARAAFDSIAGTGRAALSQTGLLNQRSINQNIVARLGVAEGGGASAATGIDSRPLKLAFDENLTNDSAPAYAQAFPAPSSTADPAGAGKGFWVRGYGGSGRLDGDANAAGADFRFGGILAGADHAFRNGLTLGVFGGYAEPRSEQDGNAGSARTRNHQLGTYGRYRDGPWHVDGLVSYARQDTDASRLIVAGPLVRTANGSYDGNAWAAHLEAGYSLHAGINVIPLAAISWLRQTQDAYEESGAGALNLSVPSQRFESLRSLLGARAVHAFQANGTQWTLEGRAAWAHEFKDAPAASARFAGDPTAALFTVTGPAVLRDSALLGVGIATEVKRDLRFYADVNAELNGQQRSYALGAGLRYQW